MNQIIITNDNNSSFEDIQQNIKNKKIILGMNTQEANLAGGAYFFRVIADVDIWEENANPHVVIKAQVDNPDNSQIWMTFQNDTQYNKKERQTFRVEFQRGRVVDIENLTEKK